MLNHCPTKTSSIVNHVNLLLSHSSLMHNDCACATLNKYIYAENMVYLDFFFHPVSSLYELNTSIDLFNFEQNFCIVLALPTMFNVRPFLFWTIFIRFLFSTKLSSIQTIWNIKSFESFYSNMVALLNRIIFNFT